MRPVRLLAYSLQHIHTVRSALTAYAFSAFACLAPSRPHTWVGFDTRSFFPLVWQGLPWSTVRLRGMGTGISEARASKRVPIFSFATQGGKQVSSHFRQRNWVQAREAQIRFPAG